MGRQVPWGAYLFLLWGIWSNPVEEHKTFLKQDGICFRCSTTTMHLAKNCMAALKCRECESYTHIATFHPRLSRITSTKGEPEAFKLAVTLKCTEVCRDNSCSWSCSKICLFKSNPEVLPRKGNQCVIQDDLSN